jgi:hypothetical protein
MGEPCLLVELLCSEDEAGLVRPQLSKGLDWRARLADVRRLFVTDGAGRLEAERSAVLGSVMIGMDILCSIELIEI